MKKFILVVLSILVVLCLLINLGLVTYSFKLSEVFSSSFKTLEVASNVLSEVISYLPFASSSSYAVFYTDQYYFIVSSNITLKGINNSDGSSTPGTYMIYSTNYSGASFARNNTLFFSILSPSEVLIRRFYRFRLSYEFGFDSLSSAQSFCDSLFS